MADDFTIKNCCGRDDLRCDCDEKYDNDSRIIPADSRNLDWLTPGPLFSLTHPEGDS